MLSFKGSLISLFFQFSFISMHFIYSAKYTNQLSHLHKRLIELIRFYVKSPP